jgi:GT2 family glycosyltransferase/glycosyltransferase involved in cell wall biosynthesis
MDDEHFLDDPELLRQSGLFDSVWYLAQYPDVGLLGLDPVEHYLKFGTLLLREPGPHFNGQQYLEANPDVALQGMNPLLHYLRFGQREKRALSLPPPAPLATPPVVYHAPRTAPAPAAAPVPAAASTIKGFFDRLEPTHLSGWAIDTARPGKAVDLVLYLDGEPLLDIRTSHKRKDLDTKGMNGDRAGFSLLFPAGLLPTGATLDVRAAANGASLSRSPKTLDAPSLAPSVPASTFLDAFRAGTLRPVTVIVPIYNAHDAVADCLASLTRHLPAGAEVLMLDDCSSDERIAPLLKRHAARPGFQLLRNEVNLGYTLSVNRGIVACGERDIVLLNSDTVVTARWLENLRYAAYAQPRVATVTALSDNAGAFSAPEIGTANDCPPHLSPDAMAGIACQAGTGEPLEVPTGNGFCMYMRRQALQAIGLFDEAKFPRGYGEENDWCMRALRAGWKNLVCDKAYVFHKRSQSFQGEKAALMEAGSRQVNQDYPEYRTLTPRFRDLQFALLRQRVRRALAAATPASALPRVLYVISTQTGGTPQTNGDLMRAMEGHYRCFLMRCDRFTITLSVLDGRELRQLETHALARGIEPVSHRSDEYDRIVLSLLVRHGIDLLHVRHLGWHSLGLVDAARALQIPVAYSLHDFYSLCPSLNLVDDQLKHCGGICSAGDGHCEPMLWPAETVPPLKHRFVRRWHELFEEVMAHCDALITTAPSAKAIIRGVYPQAGDRVEVIPHGRDFAQHSQSAAMPAPGEPIRVLVPGNISVTKGALLIKAMAELDVERRFEFHILGTATAELHGVGIHHGPYERDDFPRRVAEIRPHLGAILSIWPETYCHTLTEMWSCGVPVMAVDLGAVGDRIRACGAGWLLPAGATAATMLDIMQTLASDIAGMNERRRAVTAWQNGEGTWNDTATMALAYRGIYRRLLGKRGASEPRRVALLLKGLHRFPATAHIRVLRAMGHSEVHAQFDVRPVSSAWLLAGGADRVDLVLAQRDAVPPEHVDPLLDALQARSVPLLYEIDDLLWKLPAHHTDHGVTPASAAAMLRLARRAHAVTVSTEPLRDAIRQLNRQVHVLPNALDPGLWLKPIPGELQAMVDAQLLLPPGTATLLYMGTRSHADDLAMVAPAVQQVLAQRPGLRVIQIGGGLALPGAVSISPPAGMGGYPEFVAWFRAVCARATMAIAPLADDEFNAAKSDIKSLDYGFGLVPAAYSAVPAYARTVKDRETGLLVPNRTEDWVSAMLALLDDAPLRETIRAQAFDATSARRLSDMARAWAALFTTLVNRPKVTPGRTEAQTVL